MFPMKMEVSEKIRFVIQTLKIPITMTIFIRPTCADG